MWVAARGANRGIATVWLDGVQVGTVDLFSATAQAGRSVFARAVTTTSAHTLMVKVSGTKNASSTGTRVDVDAFTTTG